MRGFTLEKRVYTSYVFVAPHVQLAVCMLHIVACCASLRQVPYTFYVQDTEVMESLVHTVSELGESVVVRVVIGLKCIAHY